MSTPTTKKRTVTDAGLPDDDADVPCCWLCLEEGPDESGKPLVRDCSCRGTSSFAHLSCIVGWAENEGKRMKENEERLVGANVMRAFIDCPNCKQSYQNDLMRNLASAAVDFVEEEFGGIENGELRVSALSTKLVTLDAKNREYIVKGGELCSKLLALTDEMKNIDEFQRNWESRFLSMEANAYSSMAAFHFRVGTTEENQGVISNEHVKKAKEYSVKARNLCAANVDPVALPFFESALHAVESFEGRVENVEEKTITLARQRYGESAERVGDGDLMTIRAGRSLAVYLGLSNNVVEAERLLVKLAATSHRIHGPDHNVTKETIAALEETQERFAYVKSEDWSEFQVLHYTDDGESCVVQGPVAYPRNTDEEEQSKIPTLDLIPAEGTPVMCHGLRLRSVSHLNGKIGDVRSHSEDLRRCVVHFEEEGLGPTEVKHENLRILFELPKKNVDYT